MHVPSAGLLKKSRKVTNQQGDHYRKLKMLAKTRAMLTSFFTPCNSNLADVLGDPRFLQWNQGSKAL